jgi:drug/metabolite transporter (DMT)-like permease
MGGLFWAVGGVFGQTVFGMGATSQWLVPIRLFVSGVIMLAASAVMGNDLLAPWRGKKDARELVVFGVFGSALCQYGYYSSIEFANAAFATVLSYTSPVLILLYLVVRARRAPKPYELASVLLVLCGAIVCATHGKIGTLGVSPKALIWGILGAAGFAFYTVSPQRLLSLHALPTVVGWGMVIGGIVTGVLCRPWEYAVPLSVSLVARMAVVILVGTVFSFCCFQAGVRIVGSLAGSVLSSVEPVASVLLSITVLHMTFQPVDLLGFAMILSTIPIIALGDRKTQTKAA